jgi:iron complex outermembrane receptor protein
VGTGFKAGGFFAALPPNTYEPEKLTAYTLGSKNRFFEDRLQVNAEAFYWKYRDQQASHLGATPAGAIVFPTENVGEATIKGVELETQWLATQTTLVSLDAQYTRARYDDFVYNLVQFNVTDPGLLRTGCPATALNPILFAVNCSGNQIPMAPEWSIVGGVQQSFPFGENKLVFDIDAKYETSRWLSIEYLPGFNTGTTTVANASIAWRTPKWSVTGYVNNFTDEVVTTGAFLHPQRFITVQTLSPPRTYGVRAAVQF